jgi:hypothetical protein
MELIEEVNIGWQTIHNKRLYFAIISIISNDAVAEQDPLGIGIADENRFMTAVQEDAVSGLRSDAPDAEEFIPEPRKLLGTQGCDASAIFMMNRTNAFNLSALR